MNELSRSIFRALVVVARSFGIDVSRIRETGAVNGRIYKALIAIRDGSVAAGSEGDEIGFINFCLTNLRASRSQLLQDLFVLYSLGQKRNGYFVDFGATDGVRINNTFLLEQEYAWTGIVAEPALCWHPALRKNRKCFVSTDCVWHSSGETLQFVEPADAELSTVASYSHGDRHSSDRQSGKTYSVKTITLNDLLELAAAPSEIDYLSIDTEGSELEILQAFDFSRHVIRVITVEHNHTPSRESLNAFLVSKGYRRKFEVFSDFDDWYLRAD